MTINNNQVNYFNNDVLIYGSLSALSGTTFTNTIFTTTSALSVVNTGSGPALYVSQSPGNYDIASFYDRDGIEVLHVGNAFNGLSGRIGINESNPNAELSVNGSISANNGLSALNINTSNIFLGPNTNGSISVIKSSNITEPPTSCLHISDSGGTSTRLTIDNYGTTTNPSVLGRRARNNSSSPAAVQTDDILMQVAGRGYFGSLFSEGDVARISLRAAENFAGQSQGTYIRFDTSSKGLSSLVERARVDQAGLTVTGNITANNIPYTLTFTPFISTFATAGTYYYPPSLSGYIPYSELSKVTPGKGRIEGTLFFIASSVTAANEKRLVLEFSSGPSFSSPVRVVNFNANRLSGTVTFLWRPFVGFSFATNNYVFSPETASNPFGTSTNNGQIFTNTGTNDLYFRVGFDSYVASNANMFMGLSGGYISIIP